MNICLFRSNSVKMIKLRTSVSKCYFRKRCYSLKISTNEVKNAKSFRHTVFLPKTDFPIYLNGEKLIERDKRIYEEAQFSKFYAWQRENLRGKEFVLHDGPPYANGKPHMGHVINKVLKDIILRGQIVQGNRVHYIPGWDCHGLPIEMTALKNLDRKCETAKEIRQRAREVASLMAKCQMKAFQQWGVIGDWNNQCYYTFDPSYVVNELEMFWKLFEKGIIYYDLKPVFWSPSSKTALAESELVYEENHESCAVTARFQVIQDKHPQPLYLLVWTTTPWTLPMNEAVYFSPKLKYSIVEISSFPGLYILASDLIKTYQEKLQVEITERSVIASEELKNLKYRHPWNQDQSMDIFESSNIKLAGTGLLHSVPGHGHEDFLMGLENNLKVECSIDEKGCYTSNVGSDLAGLDVLNEGSKHVIEKLSSDILLRETYKHKYPYDWRTNQPVIIRASKQWFIDCERLKEKAVESLKEVDTPLEYFLSKLKSRPYWCLSRQRKWGVPIPAFFHKSSGRPLLSKAVIHHLSNLFESHGPDVWWTENLELLFPKKLCEEHFVKMEDVAKGEDIMDIWFDSGISWSYALNGKKSELYLEGKDQYIGWFQSSLLTSVAIRNEAPYRSIKTHGFAVDENGRKMSKSLGNVVDPESIIDGKNALGVDILRWWVAHHSHHDLVPVSQSVLKSTSEDVHKLRSSLRFLLGALHDASPQSLTSDNKLSFIDRYMLDSCHKFYHSVMNSYNSFNIYKVCAEVLFFVSNEISSRYLAVIKDRLYCDPKDSVRRKACQFTINAILDTLCHCIAPILPHVAEEVYSHHPVHGGKSKFFFKDKWIPSDSWQDESTGSIIKLLDEIRKEVVTAKKTAPLVCDIQVEEKDFNSLKNLQETEQSTDSELTEMLQVAEVRLRPGERKISVFPTGSSCCPRCRRYTSSEENKLCERCESIVSNLVS